MTAAYDHAAPAAAYREAALYDLDPDPWEILNLVGMEPFDAVAAGLRTRLLGWIARVRRPRRRSSRLTARSPPAPARQADARGRAYARDTPHRPWRPAN